MVGVVYQWCLDKYSADGYTGLPSSNPVRTVGRGRVARGSSANRANADQCRIASRTGYEPSAAYDECGIRLVVKDQPGPASSPSPQSDSANSDSGGVKDQPDPSPASSPSPQGDNANSDSPGSNETTGAGVGWAAWPSFLSSFQQANPGVARSPQIRVRRLSTAI